MVLPPGVYFLFRIVYVKAALVILDVLHVDNTLFLLTHSLISGPLELDLWAMTVTLFCVFTNLSL